MKRLYLDMAIKMTNFRKDTKAAEKTVVKLFLNVFSEGLAVYSGSNRFGYYRLSDERSMIPMDMMNFTTLPKFTVFFNIKERHTPTKVKTSPTKQWSMYLTEDLVTGYLKNNKLDHTKLDIYRLFNRIHIYSVDHVLPTVLNRILIDPKKFQNLGFIIKKKSSKNAVDLVFDADVKKHVLSVHTSLDRSHEALIYHEIDKVIEKEKDLLMNEVAQFEYPSRGSGVMVEVTNTGKVKRVFHSENGSFAADNSTFLIHVCCEIPDELKIKENFDEYGDVVQLMTEKDAKIATRDSRLWGTIRCHNTQPETLLCNVTRKGSWSSRRLSQHINLTWGRPDLSPDAECVDFLRISVREIATAVNQVRIHLPEGSWMPCQKYVVVGNEACKIWWLEKGDGVFKLNHKYVSNQKIITAVKQHFGKDVHVEVERNSKFKKHCCFQREKVIVDNFIKTVPSEVKHFDVSLNASDADNIYYTDFIDFFEKGKEFLTEYQKAREQKSWRVKPKRSLWIHKLEHYSALLVKPEVFKCIKDGLEVVRETISEKELNVVVDANITKSGMVLIQIHGQKEDTVKKVRTVVKKIISPDIVEPQKHCNRPHVLPFLSSYGGKKLLGNLEALFNVKILPSPNGDLVYIYGPPQCKKGAKLRIVTEIENLKEPIAITPPSDEIKLSLLKNIVEIYGKDFEGLCSKTGVSSICWNSKSGQFLVWGSDSCLQSFKLEIMHRSAFVKSLVPIEKQKLTCVACLCVVQCTPFTLTLCGHIYCEQCLNLHTTVALKEKLLPIHCVSEGCEEIIVLKDIGRSFNFSKEGLHHLLETAVSLFIAQGGESCPVRHCPTPNCPGLIFISKTKYQGQETSCGVCGVSICNNCLAYPFHHGYTCALWKCKDNIDEQTAQWFSENEASRKMCPRCGVGIERIDGCFNVHCTNCKASICFKCMEHFDDASSCYAHLDDTHGGYY